MKHNRQTTSRLIACLTITAAMSIASTAPAADKSPLARWTFDDAAATKGYPARTEGVFGKAIRLSGRHHLRAPGKHDFSKIRQITISAWVSPAGFQTYDEICRKEDGDKRILFSFQHNGTILSLGLNVGGYVECDAPIRPTQVADGKWHFCAATFDGKKMRVYLDGKQIASLDRPGAIKAVGRAPLCIGSTNGQECFQGVIDDLRIYSEALSAKQIAALHAEGFKLVKDRRIKHPKTVGLGKPGKAPGTQQSLARTLTLAMEYKPITENQWKGLSPEELDKWKALTAAEKKLAELQEQGSNQSSPELTEIATLVGKHFPTAAMRPNRERVAPYVKPTTPETKNLTADEALAALQRDWLHQAGGRVSPQRITEEIKWTRRLAARIKSASGGKVDLTGELAKLDALEKKAPNTELYYQVRTVKREIAFKNPVVDFSRILMVDMPYPAGNEWRHETRHRLGYMAVPGARLLVLDGLAPSGKLTKLAPKAPLHGSFWRPDVSFDGTKVLFCFKPHNEKAFHLYEINADGSGLTQLTDGRFDDLDPIYLPDGHIMFSTTRGHTYVRCMPPTNAYTLARCDSDGKNVYLISRNNEPDYLPSVMNDGKIIYTRWEYTDKPLWRAQGLWTVNPDGTQVDTFWGNQSVWPDLLKDARAIPASRKVMFTGSAHHDWFAGSVGIITPGKGFNFPHGITKVTADVGWPESGNGPSDPIESKDYHSSGRYRAYYSPHPLSETDFIVSACRGNKFVLYLMDVDGNRELIYEGVHNIFHAMPLKARVKPPVIEDRVTWPTIANRNKPKSGVIYTNNVYQGAPKELAGRARYLRILNIEHKTYTYWYKRPYLSTGPVVSGVQSEGVKRILGTVPIEKDGSLAFEAPPGIPLHFQLLDENHLALQTMRSFSGVMPGERRGCLGCHERHSATSPPAARAIALKRQPSKITAPPWGSDTVSYERYVRPVINKYCGKCHQGEGKGRKKVDMTPRRGRLGFDETYWLFTGNPSWGRAYRMPKNPPPGFGIAGMIMVEGYHTRDPAAYKTPKPMTRLSYKSRLVEIASSGKHNKVKVDETSRRRLIAWVDAMCPYRGDEEVRAIPDPIFPGCDWLSIKPKIKTAPRITRPGPID